MKKKIAVIAFNPVNGMGLFQYLEAFFENEFSYKTFAASQSELIKTNSGVEIKIDGIVSELKGHEEEYDALVFACGDAMIDFKKIANEPFTVDTIAVISRFNELDKMLIGHCAAGILFDKAGALDGKKVAVHPYGKAAVTKGVPTDEKFVVDKNIYTAQCENSIWMLMPELLKALK